MTTDTMTKAQFDARLDAMTDEDVIDFLGLLEDGPIDTIRDWDAKHTSTVEAIKRRSFSAWLCLADGDPVTEGACLWALARQALFSPAATETTR